MQVCGTDDWLLGMDCYVAEAWVKTTVQIAVNYNRTIVDKNKQSSTHIETQDTLAFTFDDNFINTGFTAADYFFDEQHSELVQDYNLDPDQNRDPQVTLSGNGTYSEKESKGGFINESWEFGLINAPGLLRPFVPLHVHYKPFLQKGTALGYEIPKKSDPQLMMLNDYRPPSPAIVFSNLLVSGSRTIRYEDVNCHWVTETTPISVLGDTHELAFRHADDIIQDWIDYGTKLAGTDMKYENGAFRVSGSLTHSYGKSIQGESKDEKTDINGTLKIEYEIRVRARVRKVIVNQALGLKAVEKREKPEDIITDILEPLDAVAGKNGAIQVFFPDGISVRDASDPVVDIFKGDERVYTTSSNINDEESNQWLIPFNPNKLNMDRAGEYRLEARVPEFIVKRDGRTYNKTLSIVNFRKKRDIRMEAVKVIANYGNGVIKVPSGIDWNTFDTFLRKVYPLADENIRWKWVTLDCSNEKYDLSKQEGKDRIWMVLHQLRLLEGCDFLIGIIELPYSSCGEANMLDATCIVVNMPGMQKTIAHEIGHDLDLGDEFSMKDKNGVPIGHFNIGANCPPFGYEGLDLHEHSKRVTANNKDIHPYPDGPAGQTGSLVAAKIFPFDQKSLKLKGDLQSFMCAGNLHMDTYWVTPAIWQHLYWALEPGAKTPAGSPANMPVNDPADVPAGGGPQTRIVEASGWISKSGQIELEMPWRSSMISGTLTGVMESQDIRYILDSTPLYGIVAVDGSGKKLAVQTFRPLTYSPFSDPPRELDPAPFVNIPVPFPEGTTKFQITKLTKTGTTYTWEVLKEVPVSPHAPVLSVTAPAEGSLCSGLTTIIWRAGHPDGNALYFDVKYSHDGKRWTVLAVGISQNQLTADFSNLPGGEHAYIRVFAHDGINSVSAISAFFAVPDKAPEVFTEEPVHWPPGVILKGRAYDLVDTWIYTDIQFSWTSDRDGVLGQGSWLFVKTLSPGQHIITLKATNSRGLSAEKSIPVTI